MGKFIFSFRKLKLFPNVETEKKTSITIIPSDIDTENEEFMELFDSNFFSEYNLIATGSNGVEFFSNETAVSSIDSPATYSLRSSVSMNNTPFYYIAYLPFTMIDKETKIEYAEGYYALLENPDSSSTYSLRERTSEQTTEQTNTISQKFIECIRNGIKLADLLFESKVYTNLNIKSQDENNLNIYFDLSAKNDDPEKTAEIANILTKFSRIKNTYFK